MLNFTKTKPAPIRLIKFDLEQEVTKLTNNKEEKHHECKKQRCNRKRNNKQYLRIIIIYIATIINFCLNVILPEIALGETLEGQLDRIGGLSTGKLKTIGISGATILSSIWQ
ncbi:hypothetical protein RHORCCE3_2497 [Rickettsia hoogstraalii str. RCCE3]|nr:hypothetical protein RHORCCE3_2497 [Rickettsia hoogstraalii str. RCCE3]